MSRKLQIVRTGQGITYSDGPRLSGAHPDGKVEPDAHGNRAQRRAWERLYGSAEALTDQPAGGGVGTTEDGLDE